MELKQTSDTESLLSNHLKWILQYVQQYTKETVKQHQLMLANDMRSLMTEKYIEKQTNKQKTVK